MKLTKTVICVLPVVLLYVLELVSGYGEDACGWVGRRSWRIAEWLVTWMNR